MDTRRDFIKKAVLLSGAAGISHSLPASIQRALAIDPVSGSTYLDAEHIVILMQENRSFDHCFGTLKGVRGFNDPRAVQLPDKNRVWLQTNAAGDTYAPFRLAIRETKATWMGALPHARASQVDAFNNGKYDQWLNAKRSNNKDYADLPLTLGYYTREDLPFNYALADAFTVCDQHFCSAMTSTYPNRLYLWSGTIREEQHGNVKAHIRNEDISFGSVHWKTFPERLEENGIPWKVYQNEISCGGGFKGEERAWLANYGCNPLEYFAGFNVKYSPKYKKSLEDRISSLSTDIKRIESRLASLATDNDNYHKVRNNLTKKRSALKDAEDELRQWNPDHFDKLLPEQKELFQKAFTNNAGDPYYRDLTSLTYHDGNKERKLEVPKGDVLHQFRQDVNSGNLPAVSWIVSPQNFSDHPSAPWYGAWYVSEIMDILTKDPEVWKKTIFLLTYDENDGYFDHVPPFIPPDSRNPQTGKCSEGIDTSVEHIKREQEIKEGVSEKNAREGVIGLGFRVPLLVASPWSRGGKVCSQVFDHTSPLQFLETFLSKKTGRTIKEDNISLWRRTVCGDLSAAFSPYNGEKTEQLPFLEKDTFLEDIHKAQFKQEPSGYKKLSPSARDQINKDPFSSPYMPKQESGMRPSCPLPYELYADAALSKDKKQVQIGLKAGSAVFGKRSAGSPFTIYARGKYVSALKEGYEAGRNWSYAVKAGDRLTDTWFLDRFEGGLYHLCVYGPNGFFREFHGDAGDPLIEIKAEYERSNERDNILSGNLILSLKNTNPAKTCAIEITDNAYNKNSMQRKLSEAGSTGSEIHIVLDLKNSFGWYDFTVRVAGHDNFGKRYTGRVETGMAGFSDPAMGGVNV